MSDLDAGTVCHIADGRRETSLDSYFERFTTGQLAAIQAVAMDMWEPYANSVRSHLADADVKIVYDRFHLMGYMGKAVDTVRKRENRALNAQGDTSLVGSKYLWLYSQENVPERHHERFAALRGADRRRPGVGHQGESPSLWEYRYRAWAERHWKSWYFWATHSRLEPVIEAARRH